MNTVSSRSILRFVERLERERVCLHGFELRVRGNIRAEGYYAPFVKGEPHRMYSVSKSMVSLAIGLLMDDGKLSLGDHIVDFFRDKLPESPDPRLMRLTIRDMLRMATCYRKTTYREYVDFNYDGTFFTVPPTHEPGTMFHYDTSCSQVLGALVQRLSGKGLLEFLSERVFAPLGANDPKRWLTDPSGVPTGGTGLLMSLRDLGKVAQMVMDGGCGLISADYLAAATAKQIGTEMQDPMEERYGYGYQFWRTRHGWTMYGMGGQMAIACPEERILLCTTGDTRLDAQGVQRLFNAFFDEIMSHLNEDENPGDEQALREKLQNLRVNGVPHAGGTWPQQERTYRMEPNRCGLLGITLSGHEIRVGWSDGEEVFRWDELGQVRSGCWNDGDVPTLTSAGLTEDGGLRLICHVIGEAPCGVMLYVAERHGTVSVRMKKSSDPITNRYDGVFWGEAESSEG